MAERADCGENKERSGRYYVPMANTSNHFIGVVPKPPTEFRPTSSKKDSASERHKMLKLKISTTGGVKPSDSYDIVPTSAEYNEYENGELFASPETIPVESDESKGSSSRTRTGGSLARVLSEDRLKEPHKVPSLRKSQLTVSVPVSRVGPEPASDYQNTPFGNYYNNTKDIAD